MSEQKKYYHKDTPEFRCSEEGSYEAAIECACRLAREKDESYVVFRDTHGGYPNLYVVLPYDGRLPSFGMVSFTASHYNMSLVE